MTIHTKKLAKYLIKVIVLFRKSIESRDVYYSQILLEEALYEK